MKSRNITIAATIVILLIAVGWAYWYFLMGPVKIPLSDGNGTGNQTGFQPFNRPGQPNNNQPGNGTSTIPGNVTPGGIPATKLPALRLLSDTPVGGYAASTTASTTKVRWVDRGRGNVYEASYDSSEIVTLSNTVVPKIFKSVWNKNLTAFIASLFEDGNVVPTTVYTDLVKSSPNKASSTAPLAPFELKGKTLAGRVIGYAASPDKTKLFVLMNENGTGVGYVSSFNASSPTKIFTTPLVALNVSWPSDDVIAINTKASANYSGYLYFVSPKTGVWTKILGPISGLNSVVNHTGKYVLYSASGKNNDLTTGIYSVSAGTTTDTIVRTLADKCAWGNLNRELVYCGVPSQLASAMYPDDWYLGTLATVDKIWQISATTGEVRLISSIIDQSDRVINTFELGLDPKDKYLFFMNKNDLSLWSLNLNR